MTQILSGITSEGIMVASDSAATGFDDNGEARYFSINKLFPVGSHAFIVSGGLGISVDLSIGFKRYAESRRLVGIEAIVASAGAYLSEQYREATRGRAGKATGQERLDRVYFIVGGYSFRSKEEPYQLALWGGEVGQLSLQRIRIGPCLAVPRTLSAEMRLLRMCQDNRPLMEFVEFAKGFLLKLAQEDPQVGPPFRFGLVTPKGFSRLTPVMSNDGSNRSV